jgi:hypothetical protein
VAAALDERGRLLGTCTIPTTTAGFANWFAGPINTGIWHKSEPRAPATRVPAWRVGCALATSRSSKWIARIDALLFGEASRTVSMRKQQHERCWLERRSQKQVTGAMEVVRTLRLARQSAIKARTQAANELHALVVTAPDAMRARLRRLKLAQLGGTAAAFRPSPELTTPPAATKLVLKSIAMRYQQLSPEIEALGKHLDRGAEDRGPTQTAGLVRRVMEAERYARLTGCALVGHRTSHNLPPLLTSFVGRAQEQAGVTGLLANRRLLTLTGPVALEKTRLAQDLPDLVGYFDDGVWLVELASLPDFELLCQAVATVLDQIAPTCRPVCARITRKLADGVLLPPVGSVSAFGKGRQLATTRVRRRLPGRCPSGRRCRLWPCGRCSVR